MSYSNLVTYTKLSPNHSGKRTQSISRFTPHCVVGQISVESLGNVFAPTSRKASSNYGIGYDGRVALYVDEDNRSWCTSSNFNDQKAITVEVASDNKHPYAFTPAAYDSLINLCVDCCKRYGKKKVLWLGDNKAYANYEPKSDEMLITIHRWFAAKACPGQWLVDKLPQFADEVNKRLGSTSSNTTNTVLYKVQVGAYKVKANAVATESKLKVLKYQTSIVQVNNLYKVQVGAFANKSNADNLAAELKSKGFSIMIVKV